MDNKRIGNIAVIASIFIFGINFVSMKFLLDYLPPSILSFLRFAIASIFLFLVNKIIETKTKKQQEVNQEDKKAVMITGFLGVAIYYFFQGLALVRISASLAALICAMIPIFTLLTNSIINKRKLELFIIINFIVAILGVLLVLDFRLTDIDYSEILGSILMLMAVFSWIAYTMKTYGLQKKYHSVFLLYKQTLYGTLLLSLAAIFDIGKLVNPLQQKDIILPLIANLLFVGIVCSALGYLFYIFGMNKLGLDIASLYMNLIPAVTAIASYLILNESMTAKKIVGIIIVVASLYAVGLRDWLRSKRTAKLALKS